MTKSLCRSIRLRSALPLAVCCGVLVVLAAPGGRLPAQPAQGPAADPFSPREVEGWKVQVDQKLLEGDGKEIGDKALRLLGNKLFEIKLLVPADRVKKLRQVVIFLEL